MVPLPWLVRNKKVFHDEKVTPQEMSRFKFSMQMFLDIIRVLPPLLGQGTVPLLMVGISQFYLALLNGWPLPLE